MTQHQKSVRFREAHKRRPLILPNAWDAGSERIMEKAGAIAIATTSAGLSWSKGMADGQSLSRRQMVEAIREIAEVVDVPVSADIESGYGEGTSDDVAETVKAVLAAGAIGINLEDAPGIDGDILQSAESQAERIKAARDAADAVGIDLFINARTDVYLAGAGKGDTRLDEVIHRSRLYLEAGADGIFVPGLSDVAEIKKLTKSVNAPINIMVGPGSPDISQLAEAGVARVSLGPAIMLASFGVIEQAVVEILNEGRLTQLESSASFPYINQLMA